LEADEEEEVYERGIDNFLNKDRQSLENRKVFGEIAKECVRHS
jgi:hypothetical protein